MPPERCKSRRKLYPPLEKYCDLRRYVFKLVFMPQLEKRNCRTTDEADDKDKKENAVVRILQSTTCRRLFWGANDPIPTELSKEAREEQKLRWNFDFMTETPLPGRFQWMRTGETNGKNGTDRTERVGHKRSRSPSESQCPRPEKQRGGIEGVSAGGGEEGPPSQDPSSSRLQLSGSTSSTYGVDCT